LDRFLSKVSETLSSHGTDSSTRITCLVVSDQRTISARFLVSAMCAGSLSCFRKSASIHQSFTVASNPIFFDVAAAFSPGRTKPTYVGPFLTVRFSRLAIVMVLTPCHGASGICRLSKLFCMKIVHVRGLLVLRIVFSLRLQSNPMSAGWLVREVHRKQTSRESLFADCPLTGCHSKSTCVAGLPPSSSIGTVDSMIQPWFAWIPLPSA